MDRSDIPTPDEIDSRLREAESIQLIDYRRLETLADEAIALAEQHSLPVKTAEALAYRAWARLHLDDSKSALEGALAALIIAREHGAPRVEYLALRTLGIAFDRGGMPQDALRLHELQHQIVTRLGDPRLEASVLNNMGVVEIIRAPEKASKIFLSALGLLPDSDENKMRRTVMKWNAAISLGLAGHLDDAMRLGLEAVQDATAIGTRHWAARARVSVAFIHALQGDFKAAHTCFDEVLPEMLDLDFPVLTGEFYLQLGGTLMRESRTIEAVGVLEDAYQVGVSHNLINTQIDVLKALSKCYETLNDMAGVVNTYKRMTEGVVRQQQRSADLRFAVLKTVFEIDRATLEAETQAEHLQTAALQRLSNAFRTPLDGLQLSTGVGTNQGDRLTPQAARARLQEITTQVEWMAGMMDEIAELLQPSTGNVQVTSFTLAGLTQAVLEDLTNSRFDTSRVVFETSSDISVSLRSAFEPLRRILGELLTNALKFSNDAVHLGLHETGGVLTAIVSDRGIGIPPDEQALILKPMYRASNVGDVPGSGLGLALVDKLILNAGATYELVSSAEAGTMVRIGWPLE
ncbi:MAG: HAMP domain-containing histidine kinase [Chloroflexi bacterium]|nr:HAMP domain-containing histidine kinase [Chloroflexota bacterium]